MRKLIASLLFAALAGIPGLSSASQVWIVIGDSIMSRVADGIARDHALHLVAYERDIIFKNISSPGAALGAGDRTGFNSDSLNDTIDRIAGQGNVYNGFIIQALTNDYGRSLAWDDAVKSLRRVLNRARADGTKALMLEPIWRSNENVPNAKGLALGNYKYVTQMVCSLEYPDVCKYALRSRTILGAYAGPSYYSADEVAAGTILHLSPSGHRKLADWIELEAASFGLF